MHFGFGFGLRRSEFLTNQTGQSFVRGLPFQGLRAENVSIYFKDHVFTADEYSSGRVPIQCPDSISINLSSSKSDQYGKGATRFLMSDGRPDCIVKVIHDYLHDTKLHRGQPLFHTTSFTVTDISINNTFKAARIHLGLPSANMSTHSLRIGGLATLVAADTSEALKVLHGRWAGPSSIKAYVRATMADFERISQALNNRDLYTANHVRLLYGQQGR
jgi:hypothetical protein